jgi:hypothetical protein
MSQFQAYTDALDRMLGGGFNWEQLGSAGWLVQAEQLLLQLEETVIDLNQFHMYCRAVALHYDYIRRAETFRFDDGTEQGV